MTRTTRTESNRPKIVNAESTQIPHSIPAEMSVLGAMLLSKEATGQVIPILSEDSFFRPEHRIIFRALVDLYQKGQPADPVVLRRELKLKGVEEQVGGAAAIAGLMSAVPSAANAEYYARHVRDTYMLRRVIEACHETLGEATTESLSTEEVLDRAEQRIFKVTEDRISQGPEHLSGFLEEEVRQLETREGNCFTGVPTGYTELDDLTSGLQRGELIIVAARPSMGKTAFGLNLAENMAIDGGKSVMFFSLEMSKQQIAQRMLCSRARIDSHRLRRGLLNDDEISRLHMACDVLRNTKFFIDDTPGMSILEMRAKSRLLRVRENIDIIFMDYLQLASSPGAESRQQEIGLISRGLKALARELNVPVVALAQLNRGVEGRENHRPRMSDLRESGSIEQEADLIALLHREDYYRVTGADEAPPSEESVAEVIIAKQRNGPVDTVKLTFLKKFTRFENLAHIDPSSAYIPAGSADVPF